MRPEHFTCDICRREYPASQKMTFDQHHLCPDCLAEETLVCQECGSRLWLSENIGTEDIPLCQRCFDASYTHCRDCGDLLPASSAYYTDTDEDEESPYCHDCFQDHDDDRIIQDYYYKPDPVFHGDGPRFFGVELEIDKGGEMASSAKRLLDIANAQEEYIYCKHDGSLDDGFELVTHPMTLPVHATQMRWADVLREAVDMGYSSHQIGTCGLHVHVSRTAFGDTEEQQDACIARVLYFFEKHWEELLKFSRRTKSQLQRWAARYGYKEQPMELLDHAKKGYHGGRYTCINLQNRDTVEFRMFRGTLKYNTLLATLQLVDRVCDVALSLSDEELKALSWTTFVSGCQALELVRYLKERRLYVNEPVDVEAEVYSFEHDAYCISFEELEENQRRRIPDLVTEDMYFLELDLPAFLLTKKEMIVLSNIYLNQYSVSKIATMLNTTRQNVNQIKKHAEAKLKSYYNANNR